MTVSLIAFLALIADEFMSHGIKNQGMAFKAPLLVDRKPFFYTIIINAQLFRPMSASMPES
jgi:hypothetical protein